MSNISYLTSIHLAPDLIAAKQKYEYIKLRRIRLDNRAPLVAAAIKMSLGRSDGFPTERRLVSRDLSETSIELVEEWFAGSNITVGDMAATPEQRERAMRLAYT